MKTHRLTNLNLDIYFPKDMGRIYDYELFHIKKILNDCNFDYNEDIIIHTNSDELINFLVHFLRTYKNPEEPDFSFLEKYRPKKPKQ